MLDIGVDDCLSAPFDASDLAARAQRMLHLGYRRQDMAPPGGPGGRLRFDLARLRVRIGGLEIRLSRLKYRTLWVLAQGNGAVLSFRDIETRVWGDTGRAHRQALRSVVQHLRYKLCGSRGAGMLALVAAPRVGYRLDVAALSAVS
jgi:DNA-binding response OmpR family regulator